MDQNLIDIFAPDGNLSELDKPVQIINGRTGEIGFNTNNNFVKYTLKPLADLYGEGPDLPVVDPAHPAYEKLFYTIERSILTYYESVDSQLTDGTVCLTLDRMGVNPACDPRNDELCRCLQFDLRLFLSFRNYSKHEVRQAFRTVSKSVQRHSRTAGVTGYLGFIERMLGESDE